MFDFLSKKSELYYFIDSLDQVLIPLCLNTATAVGAVNRWAVLDRRNDYAATMLFSAAFVLLQPLASKSKSADERKKIEALFGEKFYTKFNFSQISREINAKNTMLNCTVHMKKSLDECLALGVVGMDAYSKTINETFSDIFESFDIKASSAILIGYLNDVARIYQKGIEISR